jgi:GSH-dependent disulfide-bond oxidoreductase
MIDLYFWPTPNGHKVTLFLHEANIGFQLHPVNIATGEQFAPDFLKIAPNNRIPAIVDRAPVDAGAPISVFESGAILLYLADKTGGFVPQAPRERVQCLEWLFWQMGGLGPMAGQNHHFVQYAPERITYAMDRYVNETARLYGVLNKHLSDGRDYIVGDQYTISDMAIYPWIVPHTRQQQVLSDFPALASWFERVAARPATQAAYALGQTVSSQPTVNEASKAILFGQNARTVK